MTDEFHAIVERMLDFIEKAGRIALDSRDNGLTITHKGDNLAQALTEADLAISALMNESFGIRLIEEETATLTLSTARSMLAEDAWTFVGDPIDGTKPFAGGLSGWGTMIAACQTGWPRVCVMGLPAWVDERDRIADTIAAGDHRGLIIAAFAGCVYWAPTRYGSRQTPLRHLPPVSNATGHVGWLCGAAKSFTLDFHQGYFPWCESSYIADSALLLTGRLDATTFNHKLWDFAGSLPALEARGFRLFEWPSLAPPPRNVADMFGPDFGSGDRLWLICKTKAEAMRFGNAITRQA